MPEEGSEGASNSGPSDAKQADQAYIEALELIKFDTAELVVRIQLALCSSRSRDLFYVKSNVVFSTNPYNEIMIIDSVKLGLQNSAINLLDTLPSSIFFAPQCRMGHGLASSFS